MASAEGEGGVRRRGASAECGTEGRVRRARAECGAEWRVRRARAEGECGGRVRSANEKPAFVGRACISAQRGRERSERPHSTLGVLFLPSFKSSIQSEHYLVHIISQVDILAYRRVSFVERLVFQIKDCDSIW